MRYGILGDIHANLTALEAVLDHLDDQGIDQLLSVGDVVGYGAAPVECIQVLQDRGAIVVKGNHDAACLGEVDRRYFNPMAREAVCWTEAQLNAEQMGWLRDLPMVASLDHCCVVHSTLAEPESYLYVKCVEDALPTLSDMERRVCFGGHTHVPVVIGSLVDEPGRTAFTKESEVPLCDFLQAFVNVGSVGQPRDADRRAAFGIYDSEMESVSIQRVEYDIRLEANRILIAGLPRMLAERLYVGK